MSRRSFKLQPTAEKIWIELDCLGHVTCGSLFWCRGLQTFLSGDHISYYTTLGGQDILRDVIVSGCVIF